MAGTWFESLPVGLVTNWKELVEAYIRRFFPLALTFERRGEVIIFKQGRGGGGGGGGVSTMHGRDTRDY